MKFSANLGFLWKDVPLPDAIRAAAAAGFDAVECHWPYDVPAADVRASLDQTGLAMLGINTRRGGEGENGLAALPTRQREARQAIDEAIDYAEAIGADAVHVMAGVARGADARAAFIENLAYATARTRKMILIEPLNAHDAPGYFLSTTDQAAALIRALGVDNLRMMFDCYHVGRTEGDVIGHLVRHLPLIGHIQFAGVPHRGSPDRGKVDYRKVFATLAKLGWDRPLGAEYRPETTVENSLDWMRLAHG